MAIAYDRHQFTVAEYEKMITTGILDAKARMELLAGEIVYMSPIGSRHAGMVIRLTEALVKQKNDAVFLSVQNPIALPPHSMPQPDVALLRYRADFYSTAHAEPDDVLLVIEVSESSLAYDRDIKLPLYAAASIPEVWVIDLEGAALTQYTAPQGQRYAQVTLHQRPGRVSAAALPLALDLDALLG